VSNPPSQSLDLNNVALGTSAALLVTPDGRYLAQKRDQIPEISMPDRWCLFGGQIEENESPEEALRRELMEEIEFSPGEMTFFTQMAFDAVYSDGGSRRRWYFEAPINPEIIPDLVLHEGAGFGLFTIKELFSMAAEFVPYDLAVLHLHVMTR
jgi:8-oxo-dGTP diphosphatase